jgi:hypothetical protein
VEGFEREYIIAKWEVVISCNWRSPVPGPENEDDRALDIPPDLYNLSKDKLRCMQPKPGLFQHVSSQPFLDILHQYRRSPDFPSPYAVLIDSSCFKMRLFASMNRSTQFCMHGSSYLSSLPPEILEVIHLRKHMSVREWIAAVPEHQYTITCLWGNGRSEEHVLCWMVLFCVSFLMNCWSSCLSRSGRLETSGRLISMFSEEGGEEGGSSLDAAAV